MSDVQVLKPKQSLASKVGRMPTFDPAALARAEAALNGLSSQFDDWMKIEAEKLVQARDEALSAKWTDESIGAVFTRAHDIKGLATTYKFPLAGQLASSLCRLLEGLKGTSPTPAFTKLVTAHVESIRAIVRDGVRDDSHPVAKVLLAELSTQVSELLTVK